MEEGRIYRVGEVVSHQVNCLKDEFPELKVGRRGWSLIGTQNRIFPTFYETETSVLPTRGHIIGANNHENSAQYVECVMPEGDYDGPEVLNFEEQLISQYEKTKYQTNGQKRLINCVNLFSKDLFVNYDHMMSLTEFEFEKEHNKPEVEDLQVLLQKHLKWTQTEFREEIVEMYVPIFQPYGASLDDFNDAKFTEDRGFCLLGNCEKSYTAWAEIQTGDTIFIFSCRSQSGWYTYVYTGSIVRCISRTKFRGFGFENDSVIYSLEDVSEILFTDSYKPVVNLSWSMFPVLEHDGLRRIICRRDDNEHVVLNSVYDHKGQWSSKCVIADLKNLYEQGRLSPVVQSEITCVKEWYEAKGQIDYNLREVNDCYVEYGMHDSYDVPLVPVMKGKSQLLSDEAKTQMISRGTKSRYKGALCTGILKVWIGEKLYSSLRVQSVVRNNKMVVIILEKHDRLKSMNYDEMLIQSMFQMIRQGTRYVSQLMNWGYRYISGMKVNESDLKLWFSYEEVVNQGSTQLESRPCTLIDIGDIYVECGRCYRRMSIFLFR